MLRNAIHHSQEKCHQSCALIANSKTLTALTLTTRIWEAGIKEFDNLTWHVRSHDVVHINAMPFSCKPAAESAPRSYTVSLRRDCQQQRLYAALAL
jgi:hypothetical protein